MKWIAEAPFTGVRKNGMRRSVLVRVGIPRRSGRTGWACPVEITGVLRSRLVYGEDALQTLCLALDFVGNTLYSQRQRGLRLQFPTGHSVPLWAYFRVREMQRRFARLAQVQGHRRAKRPPNKPLERTSTVRHGMSNGRRAGRSAPVR